MGCGHALRRSWTVGHRLALPIEVTRDEDLLVVHRARSHQLVLHLEALARQRKDRHDMGLGMAFVAFERKVDTLEAELGHG